MEKSAANHFLILFRDASCQFRAVYTMNPETEEMVRLTGIGPRIILPEMVESIYKYSSDRKQFTVIPSKTMSMSVDAFTIPGHFWQKRPGTPKKLGTPKWKICLRKVLQFVEPAPKLTPIIFISETLPIVDHSGLHDRFCQ